MTVLAIKEVPFNINAMGHEPALEVVELMKLKPMEPPNVYVGDRVEYALCQLLGEDILVDNRQRKRKEWDPNDPEIYVDFRCASRNWDSKASTNSEPNLLVTPAEFAVAKSLGLGFILVRLAGGKRKTVPTIGKSWKANLVGWQDDLSKFERVIINDKSLMMCQTFNLKSIFEWFPIVGIKVE